MDTLKRQVLRFESLKDLKPLLGADGPCLSVYMPLSTASTAGQNPNAKQNALLWKELLAGLDRKLEPHGAQGRDLLRSIATWDAIAEGREQEGQSVAVLRSREVFAIAWLDSRVKERAEVGPRFFIRPLLADLSGSKNFYLLALSQGNTRLLRCTTRTSEEVALPSQTATTYTAYMNTAKPDHVRDNRASPGPSSGASPGIMFGTVTDAEDWDQYMAHYFRQIDRGVGEALRGRTEPLVLCAVEYEIPLYKTVNTYPHLIGEVVRGAPDGLKGGEMHARALEALRKCYETQIEDALAEWNHKVGGGASSRLKDVVMAAHEGRVLTLLISDSQEKTGVFDEETYRVRGRETGSPEDEDLANDAAVQTILHAGKALVVPHHKMPNGAMMAAIFRY